MNIFNGNTFRSSAPSTYGFEPGHVFAIREGFDEVLYKHISHDRHVLTASPLANPELRQVFPQDDLRELVQAGKLDPRSLVPQRFDRQYSPKRQPERGCLPKVELQRRSHTSAVRGPKLAVTTHASTEAARRA